MGASLPSACCSVRVPSLSSEIVVQGPRRSPGYEQCHRGTDAPLPSESEHAPSASVGRFPTARTEHRGRPHGVSHENFRALATARSTAAVDRAMSVDDRGWSAGCLRGARSRTSSRQGLRPPRMHSGPLAVQGNGDHSRATVSVPVVPQAKMRGGRRSFDAPPRMSGVAPRNGVGTIFRVGRA